jgi:hypothetical protein
MGFASFFREEKEEDDDDDDEAPQSNVCINL